MTLPIKDQSLLKQAFTHRSYLNETSAKQSNERLEFLGDSVLQLVTSDYLYHHYSDKPEGDLTALRSALVKTTTLATISTKLDFGQDLLMSRGEDQGGGRTNESLLADTFEAVVGAIYLDSGYQAARDFIESNLINPTLPEIIAKSLYKDFKSTLQETVQSQGHKTPTYHLVSQSGPDHQRSFVMAVTVAGQQLATGEGDSKQEAAQQAAERALTKLATRGTV